ncbi:uncharacterized protein LOC123302429 [Chrysoperla carnea]|uniref:uncharacterized protein LOC123302429 n=1 Tax=Chrysoperla carnea TaxID=189513 RepID=UPI001D09125A|nr:uncharacterized protein LOC123302429 [Chrysoperla carnea]
MMKLTICILVLVSCIYGLSAKNEIQTITNGLEKAINNLKNAGNHFSNTVAHKSHGLVGKTKDAVEKLVHQFEQHEANTLSQIKNFINSPHTKCVEGQLKPLVPVVEEVVKEVQAAASLVSKTSLGAAKCSAEGTFAGAFCFAKLAAETIAKSVPMIKKDKDTVQRLIPLINKIRNCK